MKAGPRRYRPQPLPHAAVGLPPEAAPAPHPTPLQQRPNTTHPIKLPQLGMPSPSSKPPPASRPRRANGIRASSWGRRLGQRFRAKFESTRSWRRESSWKAAAGGRKGSRLPICCAAGQRLPPSRAGSGKVVAESRRWAWPMKSSTREELLPGQRRRPRASCCRNTIALSVGRRKQHGVDLGEFRALR